MLLMSPWALTVQSGPCSWNHIPHWLHWYNSPDRWPCPSDKGKSVRSAVQGGEARPAEPPCLASPTWSQLPERTFQGRAWARARHCQVAWVLASVSSEGSPWSRAAWQGGGVNLRPLAGHRRPPPVCSESSDHLVLLTESAA